MLGWRGGSDVPKVFLLTEIFFFFFLILKSKPELRHVFYLPCDAHGIKLLIGDLLQLPGVRKAFPAAGEVIRHIRGSPKRVDQLHRMDSRSKRAARNTV